MIRKWKVYLVDDHGVLRQGMRRLIELEDDFQVCGEAETSAQALKELPATKPDVALVDIGLKGVSGLDLIKALKQSLPKLLILVMSMFEESLYAKRALHAGAHGYIMKHEPADKVIAALRHVVTGHTYLSAVMSERMLRHLSGPTPTVSPVDALSDRELEIFRLLGQGLKPSEIASELHLSVKTVESYRDQLKTKLKLTDASELAQYAIAWARSQFQ
jgi:DNA-binding NarL/FixJ family response regulator